MADYALDLRLGQLTDAEITPGPGLIGRLRKAVTVARCSSCCSPRSSSFGLAANVVPYLIVRLASRRVRVPVTKGTVRMLVGVAVFPRDLDRAGRSSWPTAGTRSGCSSPFAISGFVALWALETGHPQHADAASPGGRRGASGGGSPSSLQRAPLDRWPRRSSARWPPTGRTSGSASVDLVDHLGVVVQHLRAGGPSCSASARRSRCLKSSGRMRNALMASACETASLAWVDGILDLPALTACRPSA